MLALIIILVLLIGLLILPVGVDAAWDGAAFALDVKLGPAKLRLVPKKEKPPKKKKNRKPKKPRPKPEKPGPKLKIGREDIPELVKLALGVLSRFRKCLSVDLLLLHIAVAADDPYDAVLRYGGVNAALGALGPPAHRILKIREEDIQTRVDFDRSETWFEARLVATLQIWEILYIALTAGLAFLRWYQAKQKIEDPPKGTPATVQEG